ncbi:hypothetical protein [Spiroplasma endosymbiont of Crioceris asparagi]|uniref:hypothetical protein n=1 Tax=Spiroplasma endosymbiont of Crioceris asparagi TaxID=3066286 RepID=UPI0030D4736F
MNNWISQISIFIVLIILTVYIFIELFFFLKEFNKVKKINSDSKVVNNKILNFAYLIYALIILISLLSLSTLIYCLENKTKDVFLINSSVTLVALLLVVFFLFYLEKILKSVFVVIYDDNIILFKNTFKISTIKKCGNDLKRKKIYILVNTNEDYEYLKIKYFWKIKEMLISQVGDKYDQAS